MLRHCILSCMLSCRTFVYLRVHTLTNNISPLSRSHHVTLFTRATFSLDAISFNTFVFSPSQLAVVCASRWRVTLPSSHVLSLCTLVIMHVQRKRLKGFDAVHTFIVHFLVSWLWISISISQFTRVLTKQKYSI